MGIAGAERSNARKCFSLKLNLDHQKPSFFKKKLTYDMSVLFKLLDSMYKADEIMKFENKL